MQNVTLKIIKITLCFLISFHGIAHGETVIRTARELSQNKKIMDSMMSRQILENMIILGIQEDKKLNIQLNCTPTYDMKTILWNIVVPLEFKDNQLLPSKGVWIVRYQLDRCGESKIYNVIFAADSNGGTPQSEMYVPGTSNASPLLIKDAMTTALVNVKKHMNDTQCKDISVFDMRVTLMPHDVTKENKVLKGVWEEIWTFKCCDKMIDVTITFTPDADGEGTSFTCRSTPDKAPKINSKLPLNQSHQATDRRTSMTARSSK
jgi:hypothetical protein